MVVANYDFTCRHPQKYIDLFCWPISCCRNEQHAWQRAIIREHRKKVVRDDSSNDSSAECRAEITKLLIHFSFYFCGNRRKCVIWRMNVATININIETYIVKCSTSLGFNTFAASVLRCGRWHTATLPRTLIPDYVPLAGVCFSCLSRKK